MLMNYTVVLSIAGSDSSGGAGIQADIKAMSAIGVFATTAITAITAQNTTGVSAIQGISPDVVAAQIDAVFTDMPPAAVKIGMLFSAEIANVVANRLRYHRSANIILDPVMVSTSGSKLIADEAIETIKRDLFPIAEILTPNRFEAELLSGFKLLSPEHCGEAAAKILEFGGKYVLIKGGHFDGKKMIDYLFDRNGLVREYEAEKVETLNTHGTGCTLSSAIASYMALGNSAENAVAMAKEYLQSALISGSDVTIGHGHGPVNHFFNPNSLKKL